MQFFPGRFPGQKSSFSCSRLSWSSSSCQPNILKRCFFWSSFWAAWTDCSKPKINGCQNEFFMTPEKLNSAILQLQQKHDCSFDKSNGQMSALIGCVFLCSYIVFWADKSNITQSDSYLNTPTFITFVNIQLTLITGAEDYHNSCFPFLIYLCCFEQKLSVIQTNNKQTILNLLKTNPGQIFLYVIWTWLWKSGIIKKCQFR